LDAFLTSFLYKKIGNVFRQSTSQAINDINKRDDGVDTMAKSVAKAVKPEMGLLAGITCALTHLSGASGGKEGAGVQIGLASSALVKDVENRFHPIDNDKEANGTYLMCGAARGMVRIKNLYCLFKAVLSATMKAKIVIKIAETAPVKNPRIIWLGKSYLFLFIKSHPSFFQEFRSIDLLSLYHQGA
ncbi:MAG: chloride channel protein, partial [Sphaerochaetaceae bacterium]|nr:chloride channel protein [Sphaerochaetaceae bacterium]